ncbi:uncharacterized protein LOC134539552 isoform X2 [Bacillus rossius redtenbacheri]|uniref:uncharacterized protein LOC134539552 isoform X2 n=1 Tax=Bacillus rossius redtenbacheri TaxID=93214 RepID=UPI002FDE14DF
MQAVGEVLAKVKGQVADASQAVQDNPAGQAVRKQVDQLVSLVQGKLKVSENLDEDPTKSQVADRADCEESRLASAKHWALGVSAGVLKTVQSVPAYVCSTAYSAKSYVFDTLQGRKSEDPSNEHETAAKEKEGEPAQEDPAGHVSGREDPVRAEADGKSPVPQTPAEGLSEQHQKLPEVPAAQAGQWLSAFRR